MSRAQTKLGRMLEVYAAGEMGYSDVVEFFGHYTFPERPRSMNLYTDDGTTFLPGSWDEVSLAYATGQISDDQYTQLVAACTEATRR